MKNIIAKTELNPTRDTPRRIFDIQFKPDTKTAETTADQFLSAIKNDLKIDNNYSTLKAAPTKTSNMGSHLLYQQQFRKLPVTGAWLRIDQDQQGQIYQVLNELVPEEQLATAEQIAAAHDQAVNDGTAHRYAEDEITVKLALDKLDMPMDRSVKYFLKEQVYFQLNGVPILAWKIVIGLSQPFVEWKLYIDAYTGNLIDKYIITKYCSGKGMVFDPNPVAVLNDTGLTANSPIPDNAYIEVMLQDLDGTGMLTGTYVTTSSTATANRITQPDLLFFFKRGMKGFTEVMAYFHIDSAQRYIQSLGITNILSTKAIPVNVDGGAGISSYYSPHLKGITFVTGSIDDAEDAELILHEYGHAIQDYLVCGFGTTPEAKTMGEGFGDYFAASFFSDKKPASMKTTFANWKSVTFSGAEPPCMRVLNSNKLYSDRGGNIYKDAEIWSACLWEIRQGMGRMNADKIIILHHSYLTPWATFVDAAKAIITTDQIINGGRNEELLAGIFIKRGILPNPARQNLLAGAVPDLM